MRVEARYARRQQRTLTMTAAAEILGVTERTFRRWSGHDDADGGRIGGPSGARPARGRSMKRDAG